MLEKNQLGLIVPDIVPEESSGKKETKEEVQEDKTDEKADSTDNKDEYFNEDANINDDSLFDDTSKRQELISKSTEEQISKQVIRTVYVEEEENLRFPCLIVDLTDASGITIDLLNSLRDCVEDENYILRNFEEEQAQRMLAELDTFIYTKSRTKIALIGKINISDRGNLIRRLVEDAKLGGKYSLLKGVDGKIYKCKENSNDYRGFRMKL